MKDRLSLPMVAGLATALLYLARPSAYYNFDGVACAIAVELGDPARLAHGNHLLFGLAGLAFHKAWQALGYAGPAIVTLQTLDSLLGALGVGIFCRLLLDLDFSRGRALAFSAGLAFSQAYWFWSLEAQVYPLGNVFALLAFREAVLGQRGARAGLWHGLAMLGHVGHVMLAPALVLAFAGSRKPGRALARWLAAGTAVVLAGYVVGALCVRPQDWAAARAWLLGSAALSVDHSLVWYGGYSAANALEWARMTPRIFAEPEGLAGAPRAAAWALGLLGVGWALAGARASLGSGRRLAGAAAVAWLLSYAVLFANWQPYTCVYRISDLMPLWLLAAFAAPAAAAALFAAALGTFNFFFTILPAADPANNAALTEALSVARRTPENAWIIVTGRGQVYMPYFGHRRPLNMKYFEGRPRALAERLDALASAGEPVFVTSATLDQSGGADWKETLTRYGLAAVPAPEPGAPALLRARKTESPAAKAGKG